MVIEKLLTYIPKAAHIQIESLLKGSHVDILVVTVTADRFIKKNLHSPYFNQSTRKKFLENI